MIFCPGYKYENIKVYPQSTIHAKIFTTREVSIKTGHIAGWIGYTGRDGWIQTGVAIVPGEKPFVYYERKKNGIVERWNIRPAGRIVKLVITRPLSNPEWVGMSANEQWDTCETNPFLVQIQKGG